MSQANFITHIFLCILLGYSILNRNRVVPWPHLTTAVLTTIGKNKTVADKFVIGFTIIIEKR